MTVVSRSRCVCLPDQDGDLNLELEADGSGAYIMNLPVTAGWNDLSFDVSGADASVNWHKLQLRPDADGQVSERCCDEVLHR